MTGAEPLFARLYLDEDVHKRVAFALRLRQFDAVSVHELGSWALPDDKQLALAAQMGRALFTFNVADFVRLHNSYRRDGLDHAGIIVSEQLEVRETVRRLLAFLN